MEKLNHALVEQAVSLLLFVQPLRWGSKARKPVVAATHTLDKLVEVSQS